MIHFVKESYRIVESKQPGRYRIEIGKRVIPSIDCYKEEAKRSSLFGMAYIQQAANEGDKEALAICTLYYSYRKMLAEGDPEILFEASRKIAEETPFAKEVARALLKDPSECPFIQDLLPGITETLKLPLPKKIHPEQLVHTPEMKAPFNAFPDLIRHRGETFAAFREGLEHQHDRGSIRVLKGHFESKWKWESVAEIRSSAYDLRDPKFFIGPDGKLRLTTGGVKSHVAFQEGGEWKLQQIDVPAGEWIWRVTWNAHEKRGYALSYSKKSLSLVVTEDGKSFKKIETIDYPPIEHLTEGTIRFLPDGTLIALIRGKERGLILTKRKTWSSKEIPFRLGGPDFVVARDGTMWAGTRFFFLDEKNQIDEATLFAKMTEEALIPLLSLQSGADSGYPGMILEEDGSITLLHYRSDTPKRSALFITRINSLDSYD